MCGTHSTHEYIPGRALQRGLAPLMRTLPRPRTDMHFEKPTRSTALRQLGFLRRCLAPLFQTHFDGPSTRKATPHTAPCLLAVCRKLRLLKEAGPPLSRPKKTQSAVFCHKVEGGEAQNRISRSHGCTAKLFHPNGLLYPTTSIRCDCCCC